MRVDPVSSLASADNPRPVRHFFGERLILFTTLLLLALASCFFFLWTADRWMLDFRQHIPALDNLKQAHNTVIKGYLFAQMQRGGDPTIACEDACALFDQALLEIADCRSGRSTLSDFDGLPVNDPELTSTLDQYAEAVRRFHMELRRLLADATTTQAQLSLVLRPLFHELTQLADEADRLLHSSFRQRLIRQQQQQRVTLVLWFAFLGVVGGVLLLASRARRRDRAALRRGEEDLRITLQSIGDAVIVTDAVGQVRRLNPVAEQLTGWTQAQAAGRPLPEVFRIVNRDTSQTVESPVVKVLREGRIVGLANHTILIGRDGERRQIADSGAPIRDGKGGIAGVVLVFRDVTEQYRLEEELRQAQKLEAVGKLAGGVAHDFNNALTAILGGAQLLRQSIAPSDKLTRYAEMIEASAERAAQLTRQLLAFSRKGRMQSVPVDLNRTVRNVCIMLEHSIDKRIEIRSTLAAQPVTVKGDPAQLENALLNLAVNARDAMPGGGVLEFTSAVIAMDETGVDARSFSLPPGMYGMLCVRDTGTGISPEVIEHIFEPFFTTKEVGQGTGLGLSAVYGTIKEHDGAVSVNSELGQGTIFRFFLPLTTVPPDLIAPQPVAVVCGKGTILVIEDEPLLRELSQELLAKMGYDALLAEDGQTGLQMLRERLSQIDLVILDMMMPRMSGEEVYAELRQIAPLLPVLIASGHGMQGAVQRLLDYGAAGFVRKPYDIGEMSAAIVAALQQRPPQQPAGA